MDARSRYQGFLVQYYAGVAQDLPAVSPYARELAYAPRTATPPFSALVQAFQTDPFLAAKITGASNSIFFARDHQILLTVPEALERVGVRYARNLLRQAPRLPSGIDEKHIALYWAHCMAVADTAKAIASSARAPCVPPEAAYLVAMIHDIGYLLQIHYSPKLLADVAAQLDGFEPAPTNATHARQGEELARFWFLPEVAAVAIGAHHEPPTGIDAAGDWLSSAIAVSELLVRGDAEALDGLPELLGSNVMANFGMTDDILRSLRANARQVFAECCERASRSPAAPAASRSTKAIDRLIAAREVRDAE